MSEQRDVVWPAEAARLSGAPVSTLRRWARAGRVWCETTPGGHRRYDRAEMAAVRELVDGMTTKQVADLFHVDAHTVTRWAATRLLASQRTPGGELRYRREDVEALRRKGGGAGER